MSKAYDVFKTEIDTLEEDEGIKKELVDFTVKIAESCPDYFLNDGNIVGETKLAVKIANDRFQMAKYQEMFMADTRDIIRIALILHDGFLYGSGKNGAVRYHEHPFMMASWIMDNSKWDSLLPAFIRADISRLIETHMGQWNKDEKGVDLKLPETEDQIFVHECAYLAHKLFQNVSQPSSADTNSEDILFGMAREITEGHSWNGIVYRGQNGLFAFIDNQRVPIPSRMLSVMQILGQSRNSDKVQNLSKIMTFEQIKEKYPKWNAMVYNDAQSYYIMNGTDRINISKEQAKAIGIKTD